MHGKKKKTKDDAGAMSSKKPKSGDSFETLAKVERKHMEKKGGQQRGTKDPKKKKQKKNPHQPKTTKHTKKTTQKPTSKKKKHTQKQKKPHQRKHQTHKTQKKKHTKGKRLRNLQKGCFKEDDKQKPVFLKENKLKQNTWKKGSKWSFKRQEKKKSLTRGAAGNLGLPLLRANYGVKTSSFEERGGSR